MKDEKDLQKSARDLVSTSVDDLKSSLPYLKSDSANDISICEYALKICEGRGEKTKATLLHRKLNKMLKEVVKARALRLLQQAYE